MDSKLIDLFREKVNNNGADLILHRYRNNNGKNQWSIICSAMDCFATHPVNLKDDFSGEKR